MSSRLTTLLLFWWLADGITYSRVSSSQVMWILLRTVKKDFNGLEGLTAQPGSLATSSEDLSIAATLDNWMTKKNLRWKIWQWVCLTRRLQGKSYRRTTLTDIPCTFPSRCLANSRSATAACQTTARHTTFAALGLDRIISNKLFTITFIYC